MFQIRNQQDLNRVLSRWFQIDNTRADLNSAISSELKEFRRKRNLAGNMISFMGMVGIAPWFGNDILANLDYNAGPELKNLEWSKIGMTGAMVLALTASAGYEKMHSQAGAFFIWSPPIAFSAMGGVAGFIGAKILGYDDAGYVVMAGMAGGAPMGIAMISLQTAMLLLSGLRYGHPILRNLPFALLDSPAHFTERTGVFPPFPENEEEDSSFLGAALDACSTISFTTLLGEALHQAIEFGLQTYADSDSFNSHQSEEESQRKNQYAGAVAGLMFGVVGTAYVNREPIKAAGQRVYAHMNNMLTTGYNRIFRRQAPIEPVLMAQMDLTV